MKASMRYCLFLVTATLLYLGPLIAGLGGFGWGMIPVFTVIFMLWLLIMRPAMWPRDAAGWADPRGIGKFLLWAALQALIVSFCFAIGRGIGGTMGALPALPVWVPPLVSIMAIPLSRIFWHPAQGSPEMDAYADRATLEMEALIARAMATPDPGVQQAADAADRARADAAPFVSEIALLAATAPDSEISRPLDAALRQVTPMAMLDGLAEATEVHVRASVLRRAFVLAATDPDVAERTLGKGQLSRAFDIAGEDAPRLRLFAERTQALLTLRQKALMDVPPTQRLRDVATRHPEAAKALTALVAQIDGMGHA